MPNSILDPQPADVSAQVAAYVASLDEVIPAKQNQNLIVGTWNVRAFNRLTPKWRSVAGESPLRDLSNALCIAETLRRFDVVAVQEVGPDPKAFLSALQALGSGWAFLLTDVVRRVHYRGSEELIRESLDRAEQAAWEGRMGFNMALDPVPVRVDARMRPDR